MLRPKAFIIPDTESNTFTTHGRPPTRPSAKGLSTSSAERERKFFGKYASVNHLFGRENEASQRGRRAAVEALPGEKLGKLQFVQSKIGQSSRRPGRRHIHHTIQTPIHLSLAKQQIRISQPPKEFFLKIFPNHQNQARLCLI
jgi:hypothetical protein